MRKIHVLGLALVAVFAFSAVAASSALAVSKFLVNGEEVKEKIEALVAGEVLLEDMGEPPDILCSGIFEGTIEAGGIKDTITSVLTLAGELLAGALANADLVECEDMNAACGAPVDVEAVDLPWGTEVTLTAGGVFVDKIFGTTNGAPGWLVHCKSLLGEIQDECTGNTGSLLENVAEGLLGEFVENEEITPAGECSRKPGAKAGLILGSGLLTSTKGPLSVSE